MKELLCVSYAVDVLFSYAVLRLHKVEVFKHTNCYDFCMPLCTELTQRGRKQCRRRENKGVLTGFSSEVLVLCRSHTL